VAIHSSRFLRFPIALYIEPTNDCNLSCTMCARRASQKPIGYMSLDLYRGLVDQLARQDIAQLTLHQAGEPLLHPRIAEMVAYAKERGLSRVRFATNATLLTDELSRSLIRAGLDSITISMDSNSAPRYCPAREDSERLKNLDDGIRRLIALRNQRGLARPRVHMQIIEMPSTQELLEGFVQRWEAMADRVSIKPMLSWAGHLNTPHKRPVRSLICANHLFQGVIQWDGQVSFCCIYLDSAGDASGILGDARQASLEEIFFGERRRTIIESQLRGEYSAVPYCRNCPDWVDYMHWLQAKEQPAPGVDV
jgi:hypothetical protein